MTPSSVAGASTSRPKASTAIRCALRTRTLCESQWITLGEPAAAGSRTLGRSHLGFAVSHLLSCERALRAETAETAQTGTAWGATNDLSDPALVAASTA